MINTTLKSNTVKSVNLLDLESQIIEEPESSLISRIIFKRGNWFSCSVCVKKLHLKHDKITLLQQKQLDWKKHIPFKINARVDLNVDISKFLPSKSLAEDNIQLYSIECQVGLDFQDKLKASRKGDKILLGNNYLQIYIAPSCIYEYILKKHESLQKIKTANTKAGIKNKEIDSWVLNFESLISSINTFIDTRLEKVLWS